MELYIVILAAGLGKRMNSFKPKVLHEILGKPMLQYPIEAVEAINPKRIIIVVGSAAEEIKKKVDNKNVSFVIQDKPLGTGNALMSAIKELRNIEYSNATILVLNGDSPLITSKTLKGLLRRHTHDKNDLSFLSFNDDSVSGYGRVLRGGNGDVISIIEDKHATQKEKSIDELNGGIYAMKPEILDYLCRLKKHASSGEYYLTDIVSIAHKNSKKVNAYICPSEEVKGVNTRAELQKASEILNKRVIEKLMGNGVTFISPVMTIIHPSVSIERDSLIYPNTCLEGDTLIGKNCIIYSGVRIKDSIIGDDVIIKDFTIIENSRIKNKSAIGPFSYIKDTNKRSK